MLVNDIENGRANLSSHYITALHERLAIAAGISDPGTFNQDGLPLLANGGPTSWSRFVEECSGEQGGDVGLIEPAWVLAQLRWGGHVHSMAMSLGWLAMNIVSLQTHGAAIYPPTSDREELIRFLADAGPNDYDAESLRALLWKYLLDQRLPGGSKPSVTS